MFCCKATFHCCSWLRRGLVKVDQLLKQMKYSHIRGWNCVGFFLLLLFCLYILNEKSVIISEVVESTDRSTNDYYFFIHMVE